jgi:hypothetical protein
MARGDGNLYRLIVPSDPDEHRGANLWGPVRVGADRNEFCPRSAHGKTNAPRAVNPERRKFKTGHHARERGARDS